MWKKTNQKHQNKERGTELRLVFKEGLSFEVKILLRTRSSEVEEQEERILMSLREAVWLVSERCGRMLVGEGLSRFLPHCSQKSSLFFSFFYRCPFSSNPHTNYQTVFFRVLYLFSHCHFACRDETLLNALIKYSSYIIASSRLSC